MDAVLRLRSVVKSFGALRAVDRLDLEVERGRVIGLLGLNGSGKTTTMRLIMGLLRAEEGELEVLGTNPWTMTPDARRRIGYLSEKDFPFPSYDFRRAVAFVSSFYRSWDDAYVAQLVRVLGIVTDSPYSALSRGNQRKFQLALTLAPRPELVLLDDPAQGLDVTVRRDFIHGLLPLLEEGNSTVLFSSHIMSDVERLADSVAIVHRGRVMLHAPLDELKERVRRVVVRGSSDTRLRGTVRRRRTNGDLAVTVLDPDPRELATLRERAGAFDEHSLGLEDIFIDMVEGDAEKVAP